MERRWLFLARSYDLSAEFNASEAWRRLMASRINDFA